MNVPFVFSSNGHLFVEFDNFTGLTSDPRPLRRSRRPKIFADVTRKAWVSALPRKSPALLMRYSGGEATRRYYQDAAIRAVFEKIAKARSVHCSPSPPAPARPSSPSTF